MATMMNDRGEKTPVLTTVSNFRDVSGIIKTIKPNLLFRSAQIDDASPEDTTVLREEYRIRSIIDFRGMKPWPFISTMKLPGRSVLDYAPQYPDVIASTSILGLKLHYISLWGPQFSRFVTRQNGLWSLTKAIVHVAVSNAKGVEHWTKLIHSRVFADRMFLPKTIIDQSLPQVKAVFKVLSDPASYPILIMDTWGSEMVSLVVCLVALLLDADRQSIYLDYTQTYRELSGVKEEWLEYLRAAGCPHDWTEPLPSYVNALEEHLRTEHGGIEKYLLSVVGLGQSEVQNIRPALLSSSTRSEKDDGWLIDV